MTTLPVVVIGAGPVGLAAAAHLRSRDLPVVLLEAGDRIGAAVRAWGHVRTFTPWQWIVDPVAEALLTTTGWTRPVTPVPPTGDELAEHYLEPLAAALGDAVRLDARVVAVTRDGMDKARTLGRAERPFLVRLASGEQLLARAVLDASGTWEGRNPLGAAGLPAPGEAEAAPFLVGPLPDVLGGDRARFAGRRTLVVGAGHSAANTLLALGELARQEPGTEVLWAVRGDSPARVFGGGAADQLEARGRLGSDLESLVSAGAIELLTGFAVSALEVRGGTVTLVAGDRRVDGLHNVAAATGFRPDLSMLSELQLDLHPALEAPSRLAPLIDPQFHSCGTVPPHGHRDLAHPDKGFYVVGMKSYGRAPTFLVTTGNEQVRSIAAVLAGDVAAADAVELVLPETGVCSVGPTGDDTGCCGDDTHRARPEGIPAQGFSTGLAGGGQVAELVGGGGCCTG
jgi:thioredoxin reductase